MVGFVYWTSSIQRRRARLVKSDSQSVIRLRGKRLGAGVRVCVHYASVRVLGCWQSSER